MPSNLSVLAQEMRDLESETFEIRDHVDANDVMFDSCCSTSGCCTSTSSTSSSSCCS
jgi:hypothetical protein